MPLVPKNRRVKFELAIKLIDLNNVPLVSGVSFIKWHLPYSAAAEHRGRTPKAPIKDHKVNFDYTTTLPVRLTIDRSGMLQEAPIHFEILQEYSSGARPERILLGTIEINLAEYVGVTADDGGNGPVERRYLMQDSKINSTLKVGLHMEHLEGDKAYTAPPLKNAPVFGGIAGIVAGEQAEADEPGHMPSVTTSKSDSEYQDMYRRNLAAHWSSLPGELRADEVIEDLFSGGDGWARVEESSENAESGPRSNQSRQTSSTPETRGGRKYMRRDNAGKTAPSTRGKDATAVRSSLELQALDMRPDRPSQTDGKTCEVDEFELRDDLKSWSLPGATEEIVGRG